MVWFRVKARARNNAGEKVMCDDFISNRSTCSKFVAASLIHFSLSRVDLKGIVFVAKRNCFAIWRHTYFGKLLRSSRAGVLHWKQLLTLLAATLTTRAHPTTTPNCWNHTRNEASKIHASLKNMESLTCQSFRIRIPFLRLPSQTNMPMMMLAAGSLYHKAPSSRHLPRWPQWGSLKRSQKNDNWEPEALTNSWLVKGNEDTTYNLIQINGISITVLLHVSYTINEQSI